MAAIVTDKIGQKNTWYQAAKNGTNNGLAALSYLGKTVTYGVSGLGVGAINALAILKQVDIVAYAKLVGNQEGATVLKSMVGPLSDQIIDNFGTVALVVDGFVLVTIAGSYYLLGSKKAKVVDNEKLQNIQIIDDSKKNIEAQKELEQGIVVDKQQLQNIQIIDDSQKNIEEKKELEPRQLEELPEAVNQTMLLEKSEEASRIAAESNICPTVEKVLEQAELSKIAQFGLLPVEAKTFKDLANKAPDIEFLSVCNAVIAADSFDPFKNLTTLDLSGVYFEVALNLPSNLKRLVISHFESDKLLASVSKLENLKEIVIVENQEQDVDGLPANVKVSHLSQKEAVEAISNGNEVR